MNKILHGQFFTERNIFKNNNVEVYIIPEYYFEDEIMEVM